MVFAKPLNLGFPFRIHDLRHVLERTLTRTQRITKTEALIMARPSPRNQLTGCKRRLMAHFTSPNRRPAHSLTVNELADLRDCEAFGNGCERCVRIGLLMMIACYAHNHHHPNLVQAVYSHELLPWIMLWTLFWFATKEYDAAVGDLSEADEHAPLLHKAPQYRRFTDFLDDNDCYEETSFHVRFLVEMLNCFDLPETVYVDRGRLDGKRYKFHREELLIYTLMRATSGDPHNSVSKKVGQKCDQRMAKGYKWFLAYLDNRYDHLIGWNGMLLWRDQFPYFADRIRRYVSKDYTVRNNLGHYMVVPGVWFNPGTFNVVGFVDCKDYEIGTPHSGPADPMPGAPRRPWWYEYQRAFFGGHHRYHAVKMLTFMLPNGLYAAVWGPASARRDDAQLVHWSRIDDLLYHIQAQYFGVLYTFFGDVKFRVGLWRCIRGRHSRNRNGPWINARERAEDKVMNRARESAEHDYADQVQHFPLMDRRKLLKLGNDPIHQLQTIRVLHLFCNLHVCAYGNVVSSPNAMDCRPVSITTYLNM